MTHPDFFDAFAELVGSPKALVPVYGRSAVVEHGVIVAVALGTSWLMFRLPEPPADVRMNTPIDELAATSWHAVDGWQPNAGSQARLKEILRQAREYAAPPS